MSYYEKLEKLLGTTPEKDMLEYNKNILKLKDIEASAKSVFKGLLTLPHEKKRAIKLGLV